MTTKIPVVGYDEAARQHRPLVPGSEVIDPRVVPVSAFVANKLKLNSDGLYYGDYPMPPTIKVDPFIGEDVYASEGLGYLTLTCKTLDFALSLIETYKPKQVTILLKSGSTFSLSQRRVLSNVDVTLSLYDEPTYGTYNVLLAGSLLHSQYQANLDRPVVISDVQQDNVTNCWYMRSIVLKDSTFRSYGVQFDIPATPSTTGLQTSAYSVYSDMFQCIDSELTVDGVIINKLSDDSNFGFMGVKSRSKGILRGYASKFLVRNAQLASAGAGSVALANRPFFIKLLPDMPSGDTKNENYSLVPTSTGPTPSSAMLELQWTLTQSMTDAVSGSASLASFPTGVASYGIGNYIYGLTRDAQRRPLNVSSNLPL